MHPRWKRAGGWAIGLCLLLLCTAPGCSDDDGAPTPDANLDDAALDAGTDAAPDADPARYEPTELAFQMEMLEYDVPGAVFAIVEGGALTHTFAAGKKHPGLPGPMVDTTLFRVASVTKMMTAAALLQQVEDGQVALDDPVTDHLPGFVLAGDATTTADLTVQQLITHGSGMVDWFAHDATPMYEDATGLHDFTYDVWAHEGFFQSPPDALFNYSNPGFSLAGLIVENVAGVPYGEYLVNNVLVPLGMDRTLFDPTAVLADGDYAVGDAGGWASAIGTIWATPDAYDNPWGWPAAFAFSSVYDLARFVVFLRDGNPAVLADTHRLAMQSPQRNTKAFGDTNHYGYGLFVGDGFFVGEDFYDLGYVQHNGLVAGFSSEVFYVTECDLGFITLANINDAYFYQSAETLLLTLCALPAPVAPPNLDADPADHPDYVGSYHEPQFVGDITVTSDGTDLLVNLAQLSPNDYEPVLVPVRKDVYLLGAQNNWWDITFIRDATGQAEFIRNRSFVARRVPPGGPPPLPPRSLNPARDLARLYREPSWLLAPWALPRSKRQRLRRFLRRER